MGNSLTFKLCTLAAGDQFEMNGQPYEVVTTPVRFAHPVRIRSMVTDHEFSHDPETNIKVLKWSGL